MLLQEQRCLLRSLIESGVLDSNVGSEPGDSPPRVRPKDAATRDPAIGRQFPGPSRDVSSPASYVMPTPPCIASIKRCPSQDFASGKRGYQRRLNVDSQSQDEVPTRSLHSHGRAQSPRMPFPRLPRIGLVEVPLHAASPGGIHVA